MEATFATPKISNCRRQKKPPMSMRQRRQLVGSVGGGGGIVDQFPAPSRSNGYGLPLPPHSRPPFSKSGGSFGNSSLPAPRRTSASYYANAATLSLSSQYYNNSNRHRGPGDTDNNIGANSNSKRGSTSTTTTTTTKDGASGDHASLGSRETDDTYPSSSTTTNEGCEQQQHQAGGGMLTIWQPEGAIVSTRIASRSGKRRSTMTRSKVVGNNNALVPIRTASQRSLSRLPRPQQSPHHHHRSGDSSSSRHYHSQRRIHEATNPRRERSSSSSSSLPRRTASEWEQKRMNQMKKKSNVRSLSRPRYTDDYPRRHRHPSNHRVRENSFSRSLPARRFVTDDDDDEGDDATEHDDDCHDNRFREREFSRSLPARRLMDNYDDDQNDTSEEDDDDDDSSCSTASSDRQQQQLINLSIDDTGKGQFHIATRSTTKSSLPIKASTSSSSTPHHLTFHIQLNEPSQQYLIHASIGRLDKIRELHPGVNILRTLSTWNEMQKQRRQYCNGNGDLRDNKEEEEEEEGVEVKGGQLVISPQTTKTTTSIGGGRVKTTDMVMMTLMGTYKCRMWEHDSHFQRELERFVEDALQFQLCLNNKNSGGDGDGSGTGVTTRAHHERTSSRQAKGDGGGAVEREEGGGGRAASGRRSASSSGRRCGGVPVAGLSKIKR